MLTLADPPDVPTMGDLSVLYALIGQALDRNDLAGARAQTAIWLDAVDAYARATETPVWRADYR
jgi:hypothetical protein